MQAQTVERKGVGPSTLAASKKRAVEDYAPLNEGQEAHWEVVERMLFLYAKLNPGQGYVQGMNEIIGPIYYVLASDIRQEWQGEWWLEGVLMILTFCSQSMLRLTASSASPTSWPISGTSSSKPWTTLRQESRR